MTLTSLRGKVVLLHFWAPMPDQEAGLSKIVDLHKRYKNRGLVVVSLLAPVIDETYLRKVIQENGMEHCIGVDANASSVNWWNAKTREAYLKIANSPLYLIDRRGMATGVTAQELSDPEALRSKVEKALRRQ